MFHVCIRLIYKTLNLFSHVNPINRFIIMVRVINSTSATWECKLTWFDIWQLKMLIVILINIFFHLNKRQTCGILCYLFFFPFPLMLVIFHNTGFSTLFIFACCFFPTQQFLGTTESRHNDKGLVDGDLFVFA